MAEELSANGAKGELMSSRTSRSQRRSGLPNQGWMEIEGDPEQPKKPQLALAGNQAQWFTERALSLARGAEEEEEQLHWRTVWGIRAKGPDSASQTCLADDPSDDKPTSSRTSLYQRRLWLSPSEGGFVRSESKRSCWMDHVVSVVQKIEEKKKEEQADDWVTALGIDRNGEEMGDEEEEWREASGMVVGAGGERSQEFGYAHRSRQSYSERVSRKEVLAARKLREEFGRSLSRGRRGL